MRDGQRVSESNSGFNGSDGGVSLVGPPGGPLVVREPSGDSLQHAATAEPLDGGRRDPLRHAGDQVPLPGEGVVRQVFDLGGD